MYLEAQMSARLRLARATTMMSPMAIRASTRPDTAIVHFTMMLSPHPELSEPEKQVHLGSAIAHPIAAPAMTAGMAYKAQSLDGVLPVIASA